MTSRFKKIKTGFKIIATWASVARVCILFGNGRKKIEKHIDCA